MTKKATHAPTSTDAQAPQAQEGPKAAQPAPAATAAPGTGSDTTVADAPAARAAPARDTYAGRGGLYRRNPDGTRSLIERTERTAG